jgi:hypothetical protein
MKIVSDKLIPARGLREVIVEDDHGRQQHIHASLIEGPDPDEFIEAEMAKFQAQADKIAAHVARRNGK